MNLCFVTPRFWSQDLRGGEEVMKTLANNLSGSHQINVVASTSLDILSQSNPNGLKDVPGIEVPKDSLKIYRLNPNQYVTYGMHKANDLFNRMALVKPEIYSYYLLDLIRTYGWGPYLTGFQKLIRMIKPDLIHSSIFPTTSSYQAMKVSKKLNIPFIFTPYFHYNVNSFRKSILLMKIMENSQSVIACTENEKHAIKKLGIEEERIHVIPLSFDIRVADKHKVPQETAKKNLDLGDKFVILTHPWSAKGAITLLRAISGIKSKREICILSIGNPDKVYIDEKEKLLRDKGNISTRDMGWVTGDLKWQAFYSCDIFALPSYNDSFGLSYLNAWAAEKPVIAAKNSASEDVVSHDKDGFLVDVEDIGGFSELLDNLMENESYLRKLGKNGRGKLISEYNEDLMVSRYEQVFSNTVKKG